MYFLCLPRLQRRKSQILLFVFPDTGGGAVGPGWDTGNSGLEYGKIVLRVSGWTWKLLVLGGCGISIL